MYVFIPLLIIGAIILGWSTYELYKAAKANNGYISWTTPRRKNPNCLPVRIFLAIFDSRRRYSRSKIKRKTRFPFVFCSLIRIFAAASDFLPKVWRFQKKFVILQRVRRKDAMTYILQKTEIKNASHKLIEVVKNLGEEKHAKMEELRSHTNFTYTIKV